MTQIKVLAGGMGQAEDGSVYPIINPGLAKEREVVSGRLVWQAKNVLLNWISTSDHEWSERHGFPTRQAFLIDDTPKEGDENENITYECNSCKKVLKSDIVRNFCPRCFSTSFYPNNNKLTEAKPFDAVDEGKINTPPSELKQGDLVDVRRKPSETWLNGCQTEFVTFISYKGKNKYITYSGGYFSDWDCCRKHLVQS